MPTGTHYRVTSSCALNRIKPLLVVRILTSLGTESSSLDIASVTARLDNLRKKKQIYSCSSRARFTAQGLSTSERNANVTHRKCSGNLLRGEVSRDSHVTCRSTVQPPPVGTRDDSLCKREVK